MSRLNLPPASPFDSSMVQTGWDAIRKWASDTIGGDVPTGTAIAAALAVPVMRAEFGGTFTAAAGGSYLCNMDSGPKVPATLVNFRVITWTYDPDQDDPPAGYKTQWKLELAWKTNATASTRTHVWAPWAITAVAGGAGGYTETMAGTFLSFPNATVVAPAASTLAVIDTGWSDHGVSSGVQSGTDYGFGANITGGAMAANSAISWTGRFLRRFVPA